MSHYAHASEFLDESNRWDDGPPRRVEVDPMADNLAFPEGVSKEDGYRAVYAQLANVDPSEVEVRFGDTVGEGRHAIVRASIPFVYTPPETRVMAFAKPGETAEQAQSRHVASLAPQSWASPSRNTETDA